MPKLGTAITERLFLPSTKDATGEDIAWIDVRSNMLLGDIADMTKTEHQTDQLIILLSAIITDWNFTEDGTAGTPKLPITLGNVRQLDQVDFEHLANWAGDNLIKARAGVSDDEKKTLSDTSTAMSTQDIPATTPLTDY